jgi:hypothetical protein
MISADDLIILPYTPDLTQAGMAYACNTLPVVTGQSSTGIFPHLRRLVIEQAAELAFRRHLSQRNVPHHLAAGGFSVGCDKAYAVIGGRYCDVFSIGIFRKGKIHLLHHNSDTLLTALALVPSAELDSAQRCEADLLIFCFVTGLVTPNLSAMKRATAAELPLDLIYPFPAIWSRRSSLEDLGQLIFKSESNQPLKVTVVGQSKNHRPLTEEINLHPLCRVTAENLFSSLTYLQLTEIPSGRLGIRSPKLRKPMIIKPYEWGNIWVYGMQIYLSGWITRGEFHRFAHPYQSDHTGWELNTPNDRYMALPVSKLHSLEELFSKAINWSSR